MSNLLASKGLLIRRHAQIIHSDLAAYCSPNLGQLKVSFTPFKASYKARIIQQLTLALDTGLSLLELATQTRINPDVLSSVLKELETEQKVVFRDRWYLSPCFPWLARD